MTGRVTHFEIYGDEPARLAAFYHEVFGWRIERASAVDYWRIQLDPSATGGTDGGLMHRPPAIPHGWLHYVNVESLDASIEAAQRLGATVLRPKAAVPRTAWYAVLADPEGNAFAMWQPDPAAFPPPEPD